MRNLIKFLWLVLFLMLVSCGGGGSHTRTTGTTGTTGTTNNTPPVDPGSQYKKSKFYDLPVSGLFYSTGSWSGFTNKAGEFYYLPGEKISFRLAGIELGAVRAGAQISFSDLATDDERVYTDKIINLISLFDVLDKDKDSTNGIQLEKGLVVALLGNSSQKRLKTKIKGDLKNSNGIDITNNHEALKGIVDKRFSDKGRSLLNREESNKLRNVAETNNNCPYYYPPIVSMGLKNKVTCVHHERAYWLNQYSHHIQKVQIDDPRESFNSSYDEVEQRTIKIAEYMQLIPSFLEGFEEGRKKELLKSIALSNTDILFTIAKAINADFEVFKPEHVDVAYKIIEAVISSKECLQGVEEKKGYTYNSQVQKNACVKVVTKVIEAYGSSLGDDAIASEIITKVIIVIPRILNLKQLYDFSTEDYLALTSSALGTAVTLYSSGGLSSSSVKAIENIATIFSDGAVAFIRCRRGDVLKCLSSVSTVIVSSVDNVVKAGSVLGVNYIWSDINESIEFHEDYKKVMDYFISINFNMDVVSQERRLKVSESVFHENMDYVINQYI